MSIRDVARLLVSSKTGKIRLYISETTLWERGRQQYEKEFVNDRLVPFPDGINRYVTWFKMFFEKHGVIIIPSDNDITDRTQVHIQNTHSYFRQDDGNDQRDAHVLATAELNLGRDTLILCNDGDLSQAFENLGFSVRRDFKAYLEEVTGGNSDTVELEKPSLDALNEYQISTTFTESFRTFMSIADHRFHEYLTTLPSMQDKLSAKIASMHNLDAEMKKRILGYVQWFAPVDKKNLLLLFEPRHYDKDQIENNARRLKQENLLIETENHWLTNIQDEESRVICEQAMALVMPEILEIMELN